jgi:hypothetical protein
MKSGTRPFSIKLAIKPAINAFQAAESTMLPPSNQAWTATKGVHGMHFDYSRFFSARLMQAHTDVYDQSAESKP